MPPLKSSANVPQFASIDYETLAKLLNSPIAGAFEEGIRQATLYLEQKKCVLMTNILNVIQNNRQQKIRFTANSIAAIINTQSPDNVPPAATIVTQGIPDKENKTVVNADYVSIIKKHLKHDKHPYASLYKALLAEPLTINSNPYQTVQQIKRFIFSSLPIYKSKDKSKGSQTQLKLLGQTPVDEKKYNSEEVKFTSDMRQTEFKIFAKKSNTAVIVLDTAATTTGKQAIQCYNLESDNIILLMTNTQKQFKRISATSEKLQQLKEILKKLNHDISMDDTKIFELAIRYNLTLQQVASDGHCLYHSIAFFKPIYNNDHVQNHQALRNLAAEQIQTNTELQTSIQDNIELYVAGVKGSVWGGQLEITALSQKLNCPIIVFATNIAQPLIHGENLPNSPIFLAYNGENHYNALKPNSDAQSIFAKILSERMIDALTATPHSTENDQRQIQSQTKTELQKRSPILFSRKKPNIHAFFSAAENGDLATVTEALNTGQNIEAINKEGATALIIAAQNGHKNVVNLLIEKKAKVNAADYQYWTALMFAAKCGFYDITKCLLEHRAQIQPIGACVDALILASEYGRYDVINLLLDNKANVHSAIRGGMTALLLAAKNGHYKVVKRLLDKGADIEHANSNGETVLMLAALHGHYNVVNLLLAKGANVEATDTNGIHALFYAAKNHYKMAKLFLEYGANKEVVDHEGQTILMIAEKDGNENMINLLNSTDTKPAKKTACR